MHRTIPRGAVLKLRNSDMKTYTYSELSEMFERHLATVNPGNEPELLYAPMRYALAGGGKRTRPTLLLLAYNLFADDVERAMDAAAAIEIFHNFTLLHDDIMDNAAVRRGRPSVYARWGTNVAILSGDAMMIAAYEQLRRCEPGLLGRVMEVFNRMAMQVCEGQQYDMDFEQRNRVSVVEYTKMIELKTSVLLAGAARIGATLAGASEEDCLRVERFATELGLAFQLQDDLLDSYGDERLGKKIGGDILEGKKTYLMITALSHADEPRREILRHTCRRDDLSDEQKIAAIKGVYDELDIPHITEQQINIRFGRATSILDKLDVEAGRTAQIRAFAASLMGRNR